MLYVGVSFLISAEGKLIIQKGVIEQVLETWSSFLAWWIVLRKGYS